MNLEELIENKTFKEANSCFKDANAYLKNKIVPGAYSADGMFSDMDALIEIACISYNSKFFCDDVNFGDLDRKWNCGLVIPPTKKVLNNTFERSEMHEVVFLSVEHIEDECFLASSINTIYLPRNLKSIGFNAFDMADTKHIYYEGSEDEFYNIEMEHSKINTKIVEFNAKLSDINFKYIIVPNEHSKDTMR